MKTQFSLKSALLAGLAGTVGMTLFTYMAPLMGFNMDIPAMLAHTMHLPIVLGWVAHILIGEMLAIGFAAFFVRPNQAHSDFKVGVLYGLIPWFIAQIMVMPMMTLLNGGTFIAGLFSGSILISIASLIGHLIYGGVLGAVYKPKLITVHAAV